MAAIDDPFCRGDARKLTCSELDLLFQNFQSVSSPAIENFFGFETAKRDIVPKRHLSI